MHMSKSTRGKSLADALEIQIDSSESKYNYREGRDSTSLRPSRYTSRRRDRSNDNSLIRGSEKLYMTNSVSYDIIHHTIEDSCNLPYMPVATTASQLAAMRWTPNSFQKNCLICTQKFGFFRRRHHCRQCGALVCDPCSNIRDYVIGYKDEKVRVCTICNAKNIEAKKSMHNLKKNLVMSAMTIKNPPSKYRKK